MVMPLILDIYIIYLKEYPAMYSAYLLNIYTLSVNLDILCLSAYRPQKSEIRFQINIRLTLVRHSDSVSAIIWLWSWSWRNVELKKFEVEEIWKKFEEIWSWRNLKSKKFEVEEIWKKFEVEDV